jgi:predicted site-specific integrase-resolvase
MTQSIDNETRIGTSEAAKLSGFSLRHIQNMIKDGRLSASRTESGSYSIDKSEFFRVFPDAHPETRRRKQTQGSSDESRIVHETEIKYLKQINELLQAQLDEAKSLIEKSEKEKTALFDALGSTQKLLEHSKKKKLFAHH